jgi:hypothetical protein
VSDAGLPAVDTAAALAAGLRPPAPQAEHRKYWTRVRGRRGREWTEGDEIVFERFRVVWPPGLADPA